MKQNLLSILKHYSPLTPLKFTDIQRRMKLSPGRAGLLIRSLMVKGEPVCFNSGGYFYAYQYKEAEQTINTLEYRAAVMRKAAAAIRKKFELRGQLELF